MTREEGTPEHTGPADAERPLAYCLVPPDLAPKLHDQLRRHFRDDPGVEVVVERRASDRRSGEDRRRAERDAPDAEERRAVRGPSGRRVAERRAALARLEEAPALPRRVARYADRLRFVQRLEPSGLRAEDRDTARVVVRFQSGDRDAFSVLYARYYDRVYGYLRGVLRNAHEAEDTAQEVFVKVLQALPNYERRAKPFRAWLFTIVKNEALSALRRDHEVAMDPEALAIHRESDAEGDEDFEEIPALDWITDKDLMLFVERIPLVQRQILLLRFGMGLKAVEVAPILNLTPAQVRSHQRHALDYLRERMTAIGRAPGDGTRADRIPPMRRWQKQATVLRHRRYSLGR